MALINCPECGRENVSDSAESCPNCGYGIKAHFEKIKQEEERKERLRRSEEEKRNAEMEAQKQYEERIRSVPQLQRPQLIAPIVIFLITALCFWYGKSQLGASEREVKRSIANGTGDPHFYGGLFIFIGICLCIYGIYLFFKRIARYHLSKTDLEAYQRQVIREQDAAIASAQAAAAARAREEAMKPECPYCHSHNTTKISMAANVRGCQWRCNRCKSKF